MSPSEILDAALIAIIAIPIATVFVNLIYGGPPKINKPKRRTPVSRKHF